MSVTSEIIAIETVIAKMISNIISDELINMCILGVGLPANLLLHEALAKLDIKVDLLIGEQKYVHGDICMTLRPVHFSNFVNGEFIDPARAVSDYFHFGPVLEGEFKFLLKNYSMEENLTLIDILLIRQYNDYKETNSLQTY